MYQRLFDEFLMGDDTLQVYKDREMIFASDKERLRPLLEYIDRFYPYFERVVIFDKIMGNAAALLSVKVNCCEVYSPLGSEHAVKTLKKYGVAYHLVKLVPYIQRPDREDMCPMEELSIDKDPEEFYIAMMSIINEQRAEA